MGFSGFLKLSNIIFPVYTKRRNTEIPYPLENEKEKEEELNGRNSQGTQ